MRTLCFLEGIKPSLQSNGAWPDKIWLQDYFDWFTGGPGYLPKVRYLKEGVGKADSQMLILGNEWRPSQQKGQQLQHLSLIHISEPTRPY